METKTKTDIVGKILEMGKEYGEEKVIQSLLEVAALLAKKFGPQIIGPTTECGSCVKVSRKIHLGDTTIVLDDFGSYLQAGQVLMAIDKAKKEGWLLGKTDQEINRAKRRPKHYAPFYIGVKPSVTTEMPILKKVVAKVPVYICSDCGAISLGGAAGIEVLKEE